MTSTYKEKPNCFFARERHIESVIPVVQEFFKELHNKEANEQAVREILAECMKQGCVAVSKDTDGVVKGLGIAVLFYDMLADEWCAKEVMWYSKHGTGSKLLDMMQERCSAQGATTFYMTVIEQAPEMAHLLVQKKGFTPVERSYRKDITWDSLPQQS